MSSQPHDDSVPTPDHVENTGENLRRAAEVTQQPDGDDDSTQAVNEVSAANPLPDFNT